MNTSEIKSLVTKFRREFGIRDVTVESLEDAFRKQGFTIIDFCGLSRSLYAAEQFELHVLDVGQGQSVLIESGNHFMLIDGGGRDASSFVVSYLKQQGVEKLDCAAVSHYDEDHMAGMIGVLKVFPCDILLVPTYEGSGELYQSLATAALSNGCVIMHGEAGMEFPVEN